MGMNINELFKNPGKFILKTIGNNNPMANNLIDMIDRKDEKGIEQFARNLAKEKGKDPDKMFNEIKSRFGM